MLLKNSLCFIMPCGNLDFQEKVRGLALIRSKSGSNSLLMRPRRYAISRRLLTRGVPDPEKVISECIVEDAVFSLCHMRLVHNQYSPSDYAQFFSCKFVTHKVSIGLTLVTICLSRQGHRLYSWSRMSQPPRTWPTQSALNIHVIHDSIQKLQRKQYEPSLIR
jgi:hypothetical protein